MNNAGPKLTLRQERLAYRRAVQRSLSAFFDKTPSEARDLVQSWWKRMGDGDVFATGLFMHDEPLKTAAALANAGATPALTDVGDRYLDIIRRSMPKRRAAGRAKAGQTLERFEPHNALAGSKQENLAGFLVG